MKKAILILVLSLMLSGNANTAFDSKGKLTFDRCKGENYKHIHKFSFISYCTTTNPEL